MQLDSSLTIERFNRHHLSSSFDKVQYNDAYDQWFQSLLDADEWRFFTCTVVFKTKDRLNHQTRFEDTYKNRFLQKIRSRLERSKKYQSKTIPFEELYYYEREHKTLIKSISKRSPFHIHSLLPIYTSQVHRFWSYEENELHPRLMKDLLSIDIVQDVLIEPIHDIGVFPWLMYITKHKLI